MRVIALWATERHWLGSRCVGACLVQTENEGRTRHLHRFPILRFMYTSRLIYHTARIMNRPRNRQPRPPRGNGTNGGRGGRGGGHRSQDRDSRWRAGTPQQAAGTVPTIQQVIPGASFYYFERGSAHWNGDAGCCA